MTDDVIELLSRNEPKTIDLTVLDAGGDTGSIAPRGWLLGNIFCRSYISSLVADGGVGKTALRITQCLALASGRPLTGDFVFQRCRILFITLEDDIDELRRRVRAARKHHGIELKEIAGYLFLTAPGGKGGKLMRPDEYGRPVGGGLADAVDTIIKQHKIDLVAFDPFVKSHQLDENSNTAIDAVMQTLSDLAAKHNIAVDVPHHVNKMGADAGNANRGRGASAMKDAARLVYTLTPMSGEEANAFGVEEHERRLLVRMDSAKVNIAPPADTARWFKLIGVPLDNATELYLHGDEVQTVEKWTPPDAWAGLGTPLLNRILDDIEAGMSDGVRYGAHHNAGDRAAWRVVLEHAPEKSEAQAKKVIDAWLKNGVIVSEEYDDPVQRKRRKGLRVMAANRPGTELRQ